MRLKGLEKICGHAGWSEKIVRKEIKNHGFPACLEHGVWISYSDLIDNWQREVFLERVLGEEFQRG